MMRIAGNIVIYPWIWGRQPTAEVLLLLVTYKVVSAYMSRNGNIEGLRTFELVYFNCQLLHQDKRTKLNVIFNHAGQPDTPRVCRISSVDALPSTKSGSRTVHVLL